MKRSVRKSLNEGPFLMYTHRNERVELPTFFEDHFLVIACRSISFQCPGLCVHRYYIIVCVKNAAVHLPSLSTNGVEECYGTMMYNDMW